MDRHGVNRLVPLSQAWIDDRIVLTTPADTPTARTADLASDVDAALPCQCVAWR